MCELLTIAAAVLVSAAFLLSRRAGRPASALGTTALALWGAALMWSVDCVHSLMEGEGLLDLSREDTILGFIIVGAGLVVFAALALRERMLAVRS